MVLFWVHSKPIRVITGNIKGHGRSQAVNIYIWGIRFLFQTIWVQNNIVGSLWPVEVLIWFRISEATGASIGLGSTWRLLYCLIYLERPKEARTYPAYQRGAPECEHWRPNWFLSTLYHCKKETGDQCTHSQTFEVPKLQQLDTPNWADDYRILPSTQVYWNTIYQTHPCYQG